MRRKILFLVASIVLATTGCVTTGKAVKAGLAGTGAMAGRMITGKPAGAWAGAGIGYVLGDLIEEYVDKTWPAATSPAPPPVSPQTTQPYAGPQSYGFGGVQPSAQSVGAAPGQWILVPGQWIGGEWVPAHRVWVPNPR